ncbi:MAG: hypothetical protein J6J35_00450, partial [Alphaproteobacteria bacterium]|nr:hypothetical protein [Alphaproteobacteria bacterium]
QPIKYHVLLGGELDDDELFRSLTRRSSALPFPFYLILYIFSLTITSQRRQSHKGVVIHNLGIALFILIFLT